MAILRREDGTTYTRLEDISRELALLNITLNYWPIENLETRQLLTRAELTETEKEDVLTRLAHYFQQLQEKDGYQARDLIVLHPAIPNLDTLLAKFARCHTHADDEVRYIVEGEGVFGFVFPDGFQAELTIQPEEYINVPANTEHWFHLTSTRRIKAVRYFITTEGWIPEYTTTVIRFPSLANV